MPFPPRSINRIARNFLATVLAILVFAQPALAWNDRGHMVVARIAYRRLSDAERTKVHTILKQHPHYESYLANDRPPEASEEEWVFLRAATWCDAVRPPKGFLGKVETHAKYKFHRGPWHYIDFEFRPNTLNAARIPLPAETDILKQLDLTMSLLKGATIVDPGKVPDISDAANRAVRLCWLFHLIGDLHQPLHSTALVDPQRFPPAPYGDNGGNKIAVRSARSEQPIKLHAYWDQRLGIDSRFPFVRLAAEEIVAENGLTPESLKTNLEQKSFDAWAAESHEVAKTNVYLEGKLSFALWDDFEQKRITTMQVPELPAEYETAAAQIARQRVALAGYRLAECLQEL